MLFVSPTIEDGDDGSLLVLVLLLLLLLVFAAMHVVDDDNNNVTIVEETTNRNNGLELEHSDDNVRKAIVRFLLRSWVCLIDILCLILS
jgi:hypothetical protein